jgi:eukaryotic-like serine/threonine-protein kinase
VNKLGKYELIQELGRGAMGIVYRARDPIINRLVALKTITKGVAEDPNLLQRFYREAQSAGGLQHPNIITIYDMGEEAGTPYIAMELVEGESLEQVIARRPPLPLSLKLTYAIQACRAFDYAHKRGIVHRDIKPANVMLSKDGTVKVVDFGIARVVKSSKTQTGMLIGTFAYMAPEQYHGEHADERSDLWSFGVLLYELICYQRPFRGDAPANLMHSICDLEPASLGDAISDYPPELAIVLDRILQKSPADRYQSMEDLLLELDPICKGLQSVTVAKLVEQSHELVQQGDYPQARDILRQALQVESTNTQARSLLDKVNTELRRILIRPRAQEFVEKGRALLEHGRLQEARAEAENALQLDPTFEAAQELQRLVQRESDRSQLVSQYLEASKLRLAEGLPEEAEQLLTKILEIEPSNKLAKTLQQQVAKEKAEREQRIRLLDTLQQARSLWTLQKYSDCIQLLSELQQEFPHEEEILRLLETAREEQAEQDRRQSLEKAHNLLAAGQHEECTTLLVELQKRFPSDNEIVNLLDEVRKDQANQRKLKGLGEARRLLAGRRCDECISLLTGLQQEMPGEPEITRLLQAAREVELGQRRQQQVAKARKLLATRRFEECKLLLADLRKRFPQDEEIADLTSALHDEESEQRKLQTLAEARNLLAVRHHEESLSLLARLQREFPEDDEVNRLIATVQSDQAEQHKLQVLASARNLLTQRRYEECIALVTDLGKSFPNEDEIKRLLETAVRDQTEQQKQGRLAEARTFLAAGRLADAQALLETLRSADPQNLSVQKLLALVQGEQQKQGKAELLQREWKVLKELVDRKKYLEVIARAENLLSDFTSDTDLARLVDFARSQQTQVEREQLLRKECEKIKGLHAASRFQDALQAARESLKTFPGNKDLLLLQEQAESQDRKFQTRKAIEQRIRDIRVKINREKFSEAIELAKETLVTLGPSSAVTQLLSSAEVEFKARENKRKQEKELASIHQLVERGKLEEATQALQHALETEILDTFDPRVGRVSDEIDTARNRPSAPPATGPEPKPPGPGFSKEYAWQTGPPAPVPPDLAEPNTQTQIAPQQAFAQPPMLSSPPAASPPPPVVEAPPPQIEPASPLVPKPLLPASPPPSPPPARPVVRPAIASPIRPPSVTAPPSIAKPHPRSPAIPPAIFVPAARPAPIPLWRQPAAAAIAAIVLAVILGGVYFLYLNQHKEGVLIAKPKPATVDQPVQQPVNPLELRQREAMDQADQRRAAGDLNGAAQLLQSAAALNGRLSPEIRQKQADIQAEINDSRLRNLRQKEEQTWQSGKTDVDNGRFREAEKSLKTILAMADGGLRKDDARKYLNDIIPQRKREESLWTRAQQISQRNDSSSLKEADDLLAHVIQIGGPRKSEADQLRQSIQGRLATLAQQQQQQLQQQQRDQQIATLRAGAQRDLAQGDFSAARQKMAQMKDPGADTTSLLAEIGKGEAAEQARQYEASYQQALQKYQQAAVANDKGGLETARNSLQSIAQEEGSHAGDARKYVAEINSRLTALNQEFVPPKTTPRIEPPAQKSDEHVAINNLIQQYSQAYEQKSADALLRIWPGMGRKYDQLKDAFRVAGDIHMTVQVLSVDLSVDGGQATVETSLVSESVLRGGKPKSRRDKAVFRLVKANGVWTIQDVQ